MSALPLTPVSPSSLSLTLTAQGLRGDGVHDDTVALLSSIVAARAVGATLFLPRPSVSYLVTQSITLVSGDRIWADGATIDIQTDHTATGRYLGIGAKGGSSASDVYVKGLRLTCSNASARNQAYGMVSVWGGSDITLEDVWVDSGEGVGIWTGTPAESTTTGVHRLRLINPKVTGTLADGIHLSRGAQDCWIVNPYVSGTGDDGIALNSIQSDNGVNNYDQITRVHIVNPTIRDITGTTGSGIALNGVADCDIVGGSAYNIVPSGGNNFGLVVNTTGGGNGAATYSGVRSRITGFQARACKNGCQVGAVTDTTLSNCDMSGNTASGGYGLGLISSTNTHVVGGKYTGNGTTTGYGVFGTGNSGCHVMAADLRGNTTAAASTDSGVSFDPSCVTA